MIKKIITTIIILVGVIISHNTFANSVELSFDDYAFTGYFSGIQNYKSDLNFKFNSNNFEGVLLRKTTRTLTTGEVITLSGLNKTCTSQIEGLYYNSQRGNRLRPLDQNSLSGLKAIDSGYNNMTLSGGLFIGCSGDSEGIYGNITHTLANVTYEIIAGTNYNFTGNTYTGTYNTGSLIIDSGIFSGYLFDNYGGIALVLNTTGSTSTGTTTGSITPSGGGGSVLLSMDNCTYNPSSNHNLSGANSSGKDYSPSYYDRSCEVGGEGKLDPGMCTVKDSPLSQELNSAFQYNFYLGTTTICPIGNARLNKNITRMELAKMISIYAIARVGLKPNSSKAGCTSYTDLGNVSTELKTYIKLACQMNLMGIHTTSQKAKTKFDPYRYLNRAEFATVFSRLIYGNKYDGNPDNRYIDHMKALEKDKIMTKIDKPFNDELRGYTMLMIRRADRDNLVNRK